jgi:hypothetical protein
VNKEGHRNLIDAWVMRYKVEGEADKFGEDSTYWAWNELDNICRSNPELCLELILEILRTDRSDRVLANLAAGPLEDLLVRHGPKVINRVESHAKTDRQFKHLLGGVWKNAMSDEVWERVQAVAGAKW